MDKKESQLVISLDFELYWGMIDKVSLNDYANHLQGIRDAIPAILALFTEYEVHATWATVGMLMYKSKKELLLALPQKELRPMYENSKMSSYYHIEHAKIGENEDEDPYHYGHSLVQKILEVPNQELASHTFSHYYALDGRENSTSVFSADCKMMSNAASQFNVTPTSIVFPRNQSNDAALQVCKKHGITAYRGNEEHFLYKPRKDNEQNHFVRGFRLLDHYINISGHHSIAINRDTDNLPINIPASRFLRPYSHTLRFLEPLRLRRIKKSMTHAAKNRETFHLWWHPHNFGINLEKNLEILENVLTHFSTLQNKYGMKTSTMHEASLKGNSQ